MKLNPLKIIANSCIAIGLLVALAAGIYEAHDYPWHTLFSPDADQAPDTLADPAPLQSDGGVRVLAFDPDMQQKSHPAELPDDPGLFGGKLPEGTYQVLGYIKIPQIGTAENLLEGCGSEMMAGVGHVPGTAMPGENGNCALAGHRLLTGMHPFKYLDKLDAGDKVYIRYDENLYCYEVFDSFVVAPEEVWVLESVHEEPYLLTLITCHTPLNPVNRLIVRARLVEVTEM